MRIERIFVCSIAILLVSVGGSTSFQRTISSTTDSIFLVIRNSNGNCWDATVENIQVAINDLDNNSGTVWLRGNKTYWITETIIIWQDATLDMLGAEFRLPTGIDCNVVEMKDGSAIKNGVIDVSGHQYDSYTVNTTFSDSGHKAAIFLNAGSCIDSALIDCMSIESSSMNAAATPWLMTSYDSGRNGRGYGVHFYASDTDVPQWIRNVTVKHCYFRCFQHAIFLQNERSNTGTNTAHIDGNTFENFWINACHETINLSRNTGATRDNCSVSRNYFNNIGMQTGRSSYLGGEEITFHHLKIDGCGNILKNMMVWDYSGHHQGSGPNTNLTSDSSQCFVHGIGFGYGGSEWNNDGTANTIISIVYGNLELGDVIEKD